MGAGSAGSTCGGIGGVGPAGATYRTIGTSRRTVKQYGTTAYAKQASKRNEFRVSGARDIDNLKLRYSIKNTEGNNKLQGETLALIWEEFKSINIEIGYIKKNLLNSQYIKFLLKSLYIIPLKFPI